MTPSSGYSSHEKESQPPKPVRPNQVGDLRIAEGFSIQSAFHRRGFDLVDDPAPFVGAITEPVLDYREQSGEIESEGNDRQYDEAFEIRTSSLATHENHCRPSARSPFEQP